MNRRDFIAGTSMLAAGSLLPNAGRATGRAFRSFRIRRAGAEIGKHTLSATLGEGGFQIDIRIDLAVKFLGVTAYRYNLINREVWRDGQIVSVNSRVNDDGSDEFCKVQNDGDVLQVSGSRFSGTLPLEAVTTSYFDMDFLGRRPWISTQSGAALPVDVADAGGGRWNVTGELETTLIYDERGEWMGSVFDAGGETATYELVSETGLIAPLWAAS
ncbi:hypothetical protein KHP62_17140 [Rhodobacteraceae bacterium NNCM2]|nr:hypothetical protein [Coraliihabitans acroporae]